MFDLGSRLFLLGLAAVMLWMAWRVHKIQPKSKKSQSGGAQGGQGGPEKKPLKERNQEAAILLGAVGGLSLVAAIATEWVHTAINWLGSGLPLLGSLVLVAILAVDWLWDGSPDRKALVASMLLPLFVVYGIANAHIVPDMLGDSWSRVAASFTEASANLDD